MIFGHVWTRLILDTFGHAFVIFWTRFDFRHALLNDFRRQIERFLMHRLKIGTSIGSHRPAFPGFPARSVSAD